jgi:hypothetical protein
MSFAKLDMVKFRFLEIAVLRLKQIHITPFGRIPLIHFGVLNHPPLRCGAGSDD